MVKSLQTLMPNPNVLAAGGGTTNNVVQEWVEAYIPLSALHHYSAAAGEA